MNLEKPRLNPDGKLADRVDQLERYLYRLVWELETLLESMEGERENGENL